MWRIRISSGDKNNSGTWHLPLAAKTKFSVGRKEGAADVVLANDTSLSRTHGEFAVNASKQLTIQDLKSKGGVHYLKSSGDKKIGAEPEVLADGDRIRLGQTTFVIERVPLVVCMSGVSKEEKKTLTAACASIGASVVKDWQDDVRAAQCTPAFFLDSSACSSSRFLSFSLLSCR